MDLIEGEPELPRRPLQSDRFKRCTLGIERKRMPMHMQHEREIAFMLGKAERESAFGLRAWNDPSLRCRVCDDDAGSDKGEVPGSLGYASLLLDPAIKKERGSGRRGVSRNHDRHVV